MDQKVIIEKIEKFLQNHQNFKEECEVVYLLAEIRKILDSSYKALGFYCNWVLHIQLTEQSAKYISDKFNNNMGVEYLAELKKGMESHDDFFKLEDLKSELKSFFTDEKHQLPQNMFEDEKWERFKRYFLKIIAECHIKLFDNFKSLRVEIKDRQFIYRFVLNKYFKNDNGEAKNVIKIKIPLSYI